MARRSDQGRGPREERGARGPAPFRVQSKRRRDVYRVSISGELDLATREALSDELKRGEASEAERIQLDLSSVTFIDSTIISLLVTAHERSATSGKPLQVLRVSDQVRDVLELTGVVEMLDFEN